MMKHRNPLGGHVLQLAISALLLLMLGVGAGSEAQAQAFTELRGTLPTGTQYLIRKPDVWNGVLINDLDYLSNAGQARYPVLLASGYALSGTTRRADRTTHYNPLNEIRDLLAVQDEFARQFGEPDRVLMYGHSGGGHVALAMSELHPDRIDGAIAGCAHTPVWLMNTMLDGWFVAKALIAPHLDIVDLPAPGTAAATALTTAWRAAVDAAQSTPEGRARIALAVTIGQWPAWTSGAKPDPRDVDALEESMYQTLRSAAGQVGGQSRFMFEQSARSFNAATTGQLSWNNGVDYAALFPRGNALYQRAVQQLYDRAGLDLASDLRTVNALGRVTADPKAIEFWSAHGQTVNAMPQVPVLRIHTIGDLSVPVSLVQGYDEAIRRNDKTALYRSAFVDATGHCTFTAAESLAAIETVMQRLDTGAWGDSAAPERLNQLASSLHSSAARYIPLNLENYNRDWFPGMSVGEARLVPDILNLRTGGGLVTVMLTAPIDQSFETWALRSVRLEGANALQVAVSADGRFAVAVFHRQDLAAIPAGNAVDFTITGVVMNGGVEVPFTATATARVLR